MTDKSKNILKIAFVFVGNIIGAGFATGNELCGFFIKYGRTSVFGLVFSCALFTVLCRVVLNKIACTKAESFTAYFSNLPEIPVKVMNFIVTAFLWSSLCVMYSAGGAVFEKIFSLPKIYGSAVVAVLCMLIIRGGAHGFVKVNGILTVIMTVGLLLLGINTLLPVFAYNDVLRLSSPVLYSSYNTITAVAVLTSVNRFVSDRNTAKKAAALAGGILGAVSLVLWLALYLFGDLQAEIPMLELVGENYALIYCAVLFTAILTTAVGNGMAALNGLWQKRRISLLLLLIPVLFAYSHRLNTLVVKVYSFFGAVGLIIMLVVLTDGVEFIRNNKKTIENKR